LDKFSLDIAIVRTGEYSGFLYSSQANPIAKSSRRKFMRRPKNLGLLVLAIWLILVGLQAFVSLGDVGKFLDLLALIAGVLILLGR
jgi:hypothetical protein